MSSSSFLPSRSQSQPSTPPARPAPLDDARFVLRCVTSQTKRRRYGLGHLSNAAALRQVAAKFSRLSA